MFNDIPQALLDLGVTAALFLMTVWGIWRIVIPAVLKQWETLETTRIAREKELSDYYRSEVKDAREELKDTRRDFTNALNMNTNAINSMNDTLGKLSTRIEQLSLDHTELRTDISQVYRILGEKRSLIEREKGVS
jgi:septal ring factor EnvC (AmiA/AmiB activator)